MLSAAPLRYSRAGHLLLPVRLLGLPIGSARREERSGCSSSSSSISSGGGSSSDSSGSNSSTAAAMQAESDAHMELLSQFRQVVPPLTGSSYKGQHGKVGVIGGCREYTGAPYFAAIAATKVGADLTYVFCTESAAAVIKGYSPELIVMPLLPETPLFADETPVPMSQQQQQLVGRAASLISPWVSRLSCLVVGPGLGDDPLVTATASAVMRSAREAGIPIIVDGSGINIIARQPELVQGYSQCLLTPNMAELGRIAKAVGVPVEGPIGSQWQQHAQDIATAWGGPVVLSKGPTDIITDGSSTLTCSVASTLKRSGGQGDVLAGVAATFISWAFRGSEPAGTRGAVMAATYAACSVMRLSSFMAQDAAGRAMVAGDVIQQLPGTFRRIVGP